MAAAETSIDQRPWWKRSVIYVTGPWTWRNAWSWLRLILLILFIKGCVIDQYTIPSGSMEPTLHGDPRPFQGDRVLVNKWIYGPRLPFTRVRLWEWKAPERWDIVVFKAPPGASEHHTLVKRIVGLPGEHVRIEEGQVHVNGEPISGPVPPHYYDDDWMQWWVDRTLDPADRKEYSEQKESYKYGVLSSPEYSEVPQDHYFVLGDNSYYSVDSRVWGWVPKENLLGPVFAIWWPWARRRDFSGFSHTWWGALLLYGLPALLIGYEVLQAWRRRKKRAHSASPESR